MQPQPGHYAVPDPDHPDVTTYWAVAADGAVRDFPPGARWRPSPPPFNAPDQETRAELRQQWYDRQYFPWRRKVAEAIAADPAGAAARFAGRYPDPSAVPALKPPRRTSAPRLGRARYRPVRSPAEVLAADALSEAQALLAAAMSALGRSHAAIGQAMGVSEATARRRVHHGQGLVSLHRAAEATHDTADGFVAALSRLLDLRTRAGDSIDDTLRAAVNGMIARRAEEPPSPPQ